MSDTREMYDDHVTRARDKIRRLFLELGGRLPATQLARQVLERNVLTPEELQPLYFRGLKEECRRILHANDESGLPFAKPVRDDREDISTQRELLTYEQAAEILLEDVARASVDLKRAEKWRQWMLQKWGRAPAIPKLVDDAMA